MGRMKRGIGSGDAPFNAFRSKLPDEAFDFSSEAAVLPFARLLATPLAATLAAAFVFFFADAETAGALADLLGAFGGFFSAAFFFVDDAASRSAFAFSASASHWFLRGPRLRDAGRLLSHSAEPWSPAISRKLRWLSTDRSYSASFASKPSCTYSSRFLISSHSLPLLPGLRDFICASTNSPFNFSPCRRNFRSPFASASCAFGFAPGCAATGSHVPTSHTITVPAP